MNQLVLDSRRRPRVLSYGGGVDSFAVLLDAIERDEQPDVVAFVDVSDGSPTSDPTDPGEWPGTYKHIREVVMPLCARLGIRFEWIDSTRYPVRNAKGRVYQAPPLPEYVKGKAQGSRTPCTVCGAPERATKATGCGYLEDAA